jgi:hypothetical protein
METTDSAYPVRFDIDYPEEPRNRLTSAFRLILAIPILAVIAAIGAAGSSSASPTARSYRCVIRTLTAPPPVTEPAFGTRADDAPGARTGFHIDGSGRDATVARVSQNAQLYRHGA